MMQSNEEDLGLDDVESFQEFTPHFREIKLNRLVKTALADVIAESKENPVKRVFERGRERPIRPSPPVVSIRNNKENGSMHDDKLREFQPAAQQVVDERPAQVTEEAKRDVDDLPKRISRDKSFDSLRERGSRSREHRSRSRSRHRRRSGESTSRRRRRRSPSRSKLPSPRTDRSPLRRYPETRDHRPANIPTNNMGFYPGPPSGLQWPTAPVAPPPPSWVPNVLPVPYTETPEEQAKKLALEKEVMRQKMTFINQQSEYKKKREMLLEELQLLKNQRRDFVHNTTSDAEKIKAENVKLQNEILTKVKSVDAVLDMLSGLIGKERKSPDRHYHRKAKRSRSKSRSRSGSMTSSKSDYSGKQDSHESFSVKGNRSLEPKFNYSYYDPEVHWCRPCKEFPATAKEYLLHLHSADHRAKIQKQDLIDLPWHDDHEHSDPIVIEGLPTKRTPIKGLQFFVATSAWYCKLCHSWMGDLHCASLHLKSQQHANSYVEFMDKNPDWESTWLNDRGQAVIASGKQDDILKRQQEEQLLLQKKHEDELKNAIGSSGLIIPLSLPPKPLPKRRKTKKVRKKKKRRQYSDSSSSSSSSSSESSSSSSDSSAESKRSQQRIKEIKIALKSHRGKEEVVIHPPAKQMFKSIPNVPEKHVIDMPESPKKPATISQVPGFQFGARNRRQERAHEFEIKCRKDVTKKLPPPLPKSKFGFIGRMPFVRKMKDEEGKKQEEPTPPPPPVISNSPTQPDASNLTSRAKAAKDKVFKMQMALSQQQVNWPVDCVDMEMDMDIETDTTDYVQQIPCLPPPPMIRPQITSELSTYLGRSAAGHPLHQDFQDALSIIYENNQRSGAKIVQEEEPLPVPPPPPIMSDPTLNDMALLGIDLDDMAVKRFS